MPEKEQPNFPIGEKPYLSPNPKDPGFQPKDGGRGTPSIVGTEPKEQIDPTEESTYINFIADKVSALEGKVTALETKQALAEPVVIEGDYEAATATLVAKAIERTANTLVLRADEDLIGLIVFKQISGNGTRFLNVLYDASGDGTGYVTVKYQVSAQGVLSYTTEDLVSTPDPASPAEQTEE